MKRRRVAVSGESSPPPATALAIWRPRAAREHAVEQRTRPAARPRSRRPAPTQSRRPRGSRPAPCQDPAPTWAARLDGGGPARRDGHAAAASSDPAPRLRAALRGRLGDRRAGADAARRRCAPRSRSTARTCTSAATPRRSPRCASDCAEAMRPALPPAGRGRAGGRAWSPRCWTRSPSPRIPTAPPALRALRAAGLRLVVVSNWDASLHERLAGDRAGASSSTAPSPRPSSARPSPTRAIFARALALAGVDAPSAPGTSATASRRTSRARSRPGSAPSCSAATARGRAAAAACRLIREPGRIAGPDRARAAPRLGRPDVEPSASLRDRPAPVPARPELPEGVWRPPSRRRRRPRRRPRRRDATGCRAGRCGRRSRAMLGTLLVALVGVGVIALIAEAAGRRHRGRHAAGHHDRRDVRAGPRADRRRAPARAPARPARDRRRSSACGCRAAGSGGRSAGRWWPGSAFFAFSAIWAAALGITENDDLPDELGVDDSTLALVAVVDPRLRASRRSRRSCSSAGSASPRCGARWGCCLPPSLTGIIFGAIHLGGTDIEFIVPLMVFGFFLCLLYVWTDSLLPCIVLHALNNALALGVSQDWGAATARRDGGRGRSRVPDHASVRAPLRQGGACVKRRRRLAVALALLRAPAAAAAQDPAPPPPPPAPPPAPAPARSRQLALEVATKVVQRRRTTLLTLLGKRCSAARHDRPGRRRRSGSSCSSSATASRSARCTRVTAADGCVHARVQGASARAAQRPRRQHGRRGARRRDAGRS